MAVPLPPISAQQAQQAFSAAEAASAATKAVLSATPATQLAAQVTADVSSSTAYCDRVAAAHRLNERFAACATYEEAMSIAYYLLSASPKLCEALVEMLVDGDALGEIAVQLLHSLSLHDDGAQAVVRAGAAPVLTAALRAEDPLMRAHGLALLATLAERSTLASSLVKAGVMKLLSFLGKMAVGDAASAAQLWPTLLGIADCLLRDPRTVPERQRAQFRDVLVGVARAHKAGSLPLALADARTLNKLMIDLRAFNLAAPPPAAKKR